MPKKKKSKFDDDDARGKWFTLHKDVERAIWVVVFFAVAFVFFLSLIERAGQAGVYISKAAFLIFGVGAWIFPIVLLVLSVFVAATSEKAARIVKISATGVFVLVYSALFNLRIPFDALFSYLRQGKAGGYIGLALGYPLFKATGSWASLVILVSLGIISLLLMFETRVFAVGRALAWVFTKVPLGGWFSGLKSKISKKLRSEPKYIEDIAAKEKKSKETASDLIVPATPAAIAQIPVAEPHNPPSYIVGSWVEPSSEEASELNTSLRSRYRRKIDIPLTLLYKREGVPSSGDIAANKEKIKKALENFGVAVEMGTTSTGPTVTQYTLKPQEGVKLSRITALLNDLSLALAAHPIRIEAPIPGKSVVGIEVPNAVIATVGLREVMASSAFRSRVSNLSLGIGKDVSGDPYLADLERMPHLLIAGATGSGKSVCINSSIVSLLYQNSPDDLKMILIDPKRVELTVYNNIPHLLAPVITDAKKTINALKWAVMEMDRRYDLLAKEGSRDIVSFNSVVDERMPYIVIIIDELADLMSTAAKEVEALVVRLAQMARAVGIHLVLATQRPSVNVITGLIKANITARIAFSVASQIDSRTILDCAGAEKLLGRGDMLFITADLSKPKRLQGAFVDEKEVKNVVRFLRDMSSPDYLDEVTEKKNSFSLGVGDASAGSVSDGEVDLLLEEARELILRTRKASASYLQRHLRIGYARAARILDLLEAEGVIGPGDGAKPREVLEGVGEDVVDN